MKQRGNHFLRRLVRASLLLALCGPAWAANGIGESALSFGRFGRLALYSPPGEPSQVVLFVSGDGGWNLGVVDMARELARLDTLVVGVDIRHFLASIERGGGGCAYPAEDFEALGQFVQKKLGYANFHRPVLVGYSSGATLAYATLAQAPAGTFAGAVSLGFCPDLMLRRPLCVGAGLTHKTNRTLGQVFDPIPRIAEPWVALHGDLDQVCSPETTAAYVRQVQGGTLVRLPKVGHGFSVPRNWMPQFKSAFAAFTRAAPAKTLHADADLGDLPLAAVPARQPGDTLAILLTGDGGWAGLDRGLASALAARGVAVIGWDSLRYYWTPRTPDGAARDLARILTHYRTALKRPRVVLIGYSFGADALPFLANRLPAELRRDVAKVVLLGPGPRARFEFKLAEWLGRAGGGLDVYGEVARFTGLPLLCVRGAEESDSICPRLDAHAARIVTLPGGHHFDGDYQGLARLILE